MSAHCWQPAGWPAPGNVIAGYTLRHGGVSRGPFASMNIAAHVGDEPEAVTENRRRMVQECGLPAEPLWLEQVHGTRVARPGDLAGEADAIVTAAADTVCVIQTADCLPILFTAADGSEIAAAHAGWRGLADGVLEATVAAMRPEPARLLAWIGPAISQPAFEVGDEVRQRFTASDPASAALFVANRAGRWQADLAGLARLRLAHLGVAQVYEAERCTFGEADAFFSYRRDGQCGRFASLIYRRGSP